MQQLGVSREAGDILLWLLLWIVLGMVKHAQRNDLADFDQTTIQL